MTTKNTDTEKKWREEFEALQFKYKNNLERSWNGYVDGEIHSRWIMYEAARKKAHSEREDAFKAFTLDLVDRYEKEIEKRDNLLEQAKPYFTGDFPLIKQWLKDYEELKK